VGTQPNKYNLVGGTVEREGSLEVTVGQTLQLIANGLQSRPAALGIYFFYRCLAGCCTASPVQQPKALRG